MKDRAQRLMPRDFVGYGNRPPSFDWPEKARLAVSFVVNFEEGSELSIGDGDARNEFEYEEILELKGVPDLCMESHFEYGTRAAYWRVMGLLQTHRAYTTVNACVRALERSPALARDAMARGHEIGCHGYRWEGPVGLTERQERQQIATCVRVIHEITGARPVGWHSRSSASVNTRRLLVEEGGFLYDSDAYNDDLPYVVAVGGKSHVVLPYSFDTNDMRFFQSFGFVQAKDFAEYCIAAFDWLWREAADQPRMMTIGLHLRIIGRPGRIAGLETVLRHVMAKEKVWVARRCDIARHWMEQTARRA